MENILISFFFLRSLAQCHLILVVAIPYGGRIDFDEYNFKYDLIFNLLDGKSLGKPAFVKILVN